LTWRALFICHYTWVPDDEGPEGPEHLWQARGLFPHPLPPGSAESQAARRRFVFIGRLVGKALLDGHILPLPISPAFVRAAVLVGPGRNRSKHP
jgi:hypothetical protein